MMIGPWNLRTNCQGWIPRIWQLCSTSLWKWVWVLVLQLRCSWQLGPDTENRKWKTGLTEMDENGNSISVYDGNGISIYVRLRNAKLANLPFCTFWKPKIGKPPFLFAWEMWIWQISISVRLHHREFQTLLFQSNSPLMFSFITFLFGIQI